MGSRRCDSNEERFGLSSPLFDQVQTSERSDSRQLHEVWDLPSYPQDISLMKPLIQHGPFSVLCKDRDIVDISVGINLHGILASNNERTQGSLQAFQNESNPRTC